MNKNLQKTQIIHNIVSWAWVREREIERERWGSLKEGWHNLAASPASGELTAFPVAMVTCSKLPSEDGSVISNESEKLNSGRGLTVLKVTAQQKLTKEETRKRDGESHSLTQIIYATSSHADKVRRVMDAPPPKKFFSTHTFFPSLLTQVSLREIARPLQIFLFLTQR